jgi:hypothetical protein
VLDQAGEKTCKGYIGNNAVQNEGILSTTMLIMAMLGIVPITVKYNLGIKYCTP